MRYKYLSIIIIVLLCIPFISAELYSCYDSDLDSYDTSSWIEVNDADAEPGQGIYKLYDYCNEAGEEVDSCEGFNCYVMERECIQDGDYYAEITTGIRCEEIGYNKCVAGACVNEEETEEEELPIETLLDNADDSNELIEVETEIVVDEGEIEIEVLPVNDEEIIIEVEDPEIEVEIVTSDEETVAVEVEAEIMIVNDDPVILEVEEEEVMVVNDDKSPIRIILDLLSGLFTTESSEIIVDEGEIEVDAVLVEDETEIAEVDFNADESEAEIVICSSTDPENDIHIKGTTFGEGSSKNFIDRLTTGELFGVVEIDDTCNDFLGLGISFSIKQYNCNEEDLVVRYTSNCEFGCQEGRCLTEEEESDSVLADIAESIEE
mgnify:FL=1